MTKIPFLLVYLRLFIAFLIGGLVFTEVANLNIIIVVLSFVGLLSDVFDGIIARKLNVATERLRIWDSNVDMVFWAFIIFSTFYLNLPFFKINSFLILLVIALEITTYIVCFLKFKKTVATHSILAKTWTITLFIFLIDLLLNSDSSYSFYSCIILGIISRLEILGMILALKKWTVDVPSIFSVKKLNSRA
jgi:CDP-diacylglycerol--glycerol-3-phosphate 3-phosphatidyltransferase